MIGLSTIVDTTTLANRDEIKLAIANVHEALVDAFNDLREIRRIETDADIPVTERQGMYAAFYVHLWRAYKDRFGKNLSTALGADLGFLWQKDDTFESGAAHLVDDHPELASWRGSCTGAGRCVVAVQANSAVRVTFRRG